MARLIVMALVAIGIFSMIPSLASNWLERNGYSEPEQTQAVVSRDTFGDNDRNGGDAVLFAGPGGHFYTQAYLNGKAIRVVIDTGATRLALTYEDARRLGIRLNKSDFKYPANTANGRVYYARTTLRSVRIGGVSRHNIDASVAPEGALSITLMGMSFLKKLRNFQFVNGRLILEG